MVLGGGIPITKLTAKQQRFVDEYLAGADVKQAAACAGYSSRTSARHLLRSPNIQKVLQESMGRLEEENVEEAREEAASITAEEALRQAEAAGAVEALHTLVAIVRGEVKEQVPAPGKNGKQELVWREPTLKDRIHAAELLAKRYDAAAGKPGDSSTPPIVIRDDLKEHVEDG